MPTCRRRLSIGRLKWELHFFVDLLQPVEHSYILVLWVLRHCLSCHSTRYTWYMLAWCSCGHLGKLFLFVCGHLLQFLNLVWIPIFKDKRLYGIRPWNTILGSHSRLLCGKMCCNSKLQCLHNYATWIIFHLSGLSSAASLWRRGIFSFEFWAAASATSFESLWLALSGTWFCPPGLLCRVVYFQLFLVLFSTGGTNFYNIPVLCSGGTLVWVFRRWCSWHFGSQRFICRSSGASMQFSFSSFSRCVTMCSYVPFSKWAWFFYFSSCGGILAYMNCSMMAWAAFPNVSLTNFGSWSGNSTKF